MSGDPKVIEVLFAALRNELTAVSQYWLHYRREEDWGLGKMAKKNRAESIEEMEHADSLIQRIITLGGHPNLQKLNLLRIGQTVQ
ncbi:bacterioferritin [Pelagimonas varians]|uniref:Bacterioferritin n=1 Tax=Pelagimonas varians TaxID=696760 RepID=A0A238KEQ6_9RHOB|nr:bacterioferritin [Pelagimonas varians]SMX41289.1 Bacterioferritin [Pelagimonas varians]